MAKLYQLVKVHTLKQLLSFAMADQPSSSILDCPLIWNNIVNLFDDVMRNMVVYRLCKKSRQLCAVAAKVLVPPALSCRRGIYRMSMSEETRD